MRLLSNREPPSDCDTTAVLGELLPLVVFPRRGGALAEDWAQPLRGCADRYLTRLGCILFRGFQVGERRSFVDFVSAFGQAPSPRDLLDPWNVAAHGCADHAASGPRAGEAPLRSIRTQHGAQPARHWLHCVQVPGACESRVVDQRDADRRLPAAIRALLVNRGLRYVRNFAGAVDSHWSDAFGTSDRTRVEAWCRANRTQLEWKKDGGLRIQRSGAGLAWHPLSHERLWLDHVQLFHAAHAAADLARALPDSADEDSQPINVYYGDGLPIERGVIEQVKSALHAATSRVSWEQGDVLLLDDLLVRHCSVPIGPPFACAAGWST